MKSKRVYVNMPEFDKNTNGTRKVWRTDGVITFACSFTPSLFIWEKSTKHNNYEGYSGYVDAAVVTEVA